MEPATARFGTSCALPRVMRTTGRDGIALAPGGGHRRAGVLVFLGIRLIPIYIHNHELQQFVEDVTHRAAEPTSSDDVLRSWILDKAAHTGPSGGGR